MEWRAVPSLSALRAFEAAARLKSLSGAARELNVTHAAIAQHVRALEDRFGVALLERDGRAMRPTGPGAALARGLSDGFGTIAAAVRDVSQDAARPLRIALTPSFAENWLMPVIAKFWAEYPDIRLELVPGEALADFRADGIDLAIRYGRGGWPGTDPEPLVTAAHVVVAAPALTQFGPDCRLNDLLDQTWLLERRRAEELLWLKAMGMDVGAMKTVAFDTISMVLQAARGGAGIAVMPAALVAQDIAEGRLNALCRDEASDLAYHIVRRPGGAAPRALEVFVKWLRSQVR